MLVIRKKFKNVRKIHIITTLSQIKKSKNSTRIDDDCKYNNFTILKHASSISIEQTSLFTYLLIKP